MSRILRDFICKTTDFQLVFNFEQTRMVTIVGEHGIMAHIPCYVVIFHTQMSSSQS